MILFRLSRIIVDMISSSDLSNYAQKDFSSTGIIGGMVTFLFLIYDSF